MRIGVIGSQATRSWDEQSLVVRRFANALACFADVDLLMPGPAEDVRREGALTVRTFEAVPTEPNRRRALEEMAFGPDRHRGGLRCTCTDRLLTAAAQTLPLDLQQELIWSSGGRSPGLLQHLVDGPYDLVVATDYRRAVTHDVAAITAETTPIVLLATAVPDPLLHFDVHDAVFDRAAAVVIVSDGEHQRLRARGVDADRIRNLRFVVQVHDLVWRNEPLNYDKKPMIVIPREWGDDHETDRIIRLATRIERELEWRVRVRVVGRGWDLAPGPLQGPYSSGRFDVWRWCCRALAVIDPDPGKLLGREVLETMLYKVPVLVPAQAGAGLDHVVSGSGGLWYRSDDELLACIAELLDHRDTRDALGEQAYDYATTSYSSTDDYLKNVKQLLDEVLP